jgi:zona occludens toxin
MAITLITGAPGAGKTAALVKLLMALSKNRAVYVDGIPDLKIPHIPLLAPDQWMTEVPDGSVVVIDEVQRVWRPGGAGAKVAPSIAALETHRHHGLDFFIITQHPGLVHSNVRKLVGRHIHLRDVGYLGRWWYEWPECTNPETFRTAPIKERYRIDAATFDQYTSASLHVKPIRKLPRSVVVLGLALVALLYLSSMAYSAISGKISPKPAPVATAPRAAPVQPVAAPGPAPSSEAAEPDARAGDEALAAGPAVAGCIASRDRCKCFDDSGRLMVVELELCQRSAVGFSGLVALNMAPSVPGAPVAAVRSVRALSAVDDPSGPARFVPDAVAPRGYGSPAALVSDALNGTSRLYR